MTLNNTTDSKQTQSFQLQKTLNSDSYSEAGHVKFEDDNSQTIEGGFHGDFQQAVNSYDRNPRPDGHFVAMVGYPEYQGYQSEYGNAGHEIGYGNDPSKIQEHYSPAVHELDDQYHHQNAFVQPFKIGKLEKPESLLGYPASQVASLENGGQPNSVYYVTHQVTRTKKFPYPMHHHGFHQEGHYPDGFQFPLFAEDKRLV